MVESTCFQHTSSHPDKYNNSVNRIISKEEEREDPRRDSSIYLRIQCFHKELQELQYFYTQSSIPTRTPSVSTQTAVFYNYSTYRINSTTRNLQEIIQLQGSSRAGIFK